MRTPKRDRGFSLIEVMVGLFLVAVAVLGLAQLFLVAVANNLKADRIANATFLAQQQIDWLRGFTGDELDVYSSTPLDQRDEIIDLNADGTNDYRRITGISNDNGTFHVNVHVYSMERGAGLSAATLLADPQQYPDRAMISTLIRR
ncbi:MAG TPA: prepilin-type N-terminal cleavage/methylation domain-containing protein [Candidatus Bathyarchaeia archaeon]|nr:prepilin-type N-terminal cleavage/methylation domain-containing protein [Candidatus Bathyarchaeia archaeon]